MSICPVFTGKKLQRGYDIEPWYKKQIKDRITSNPNTTQPIITFFTFISNKYCFGQPLLACSVLIDIMMDACWHEFGYILASN